MGVMVLLAVPMVMVGGRTVRVSVLFHRQRLQ